MMRQSERAEFDFYVNKVIKGVPHLAWARDLSSAGMYVCALLEPHTETNAPLAVEFELPDTSRVIWAQAEVVHRNAKDVGLRFVDLTPRDRRAIDAWVASNERDGCPA
jgi:c-di-GMP-binding flagellar brake protein YcgR